MPAYALADNLIGSLALHNRKIFFEALFAAGSQTLLALGADAFTATCGRSGTSSRST